MQQRITQITLTTEGSPIFAEGNYTVTIVDEGGGEFVEIAELQSADAPKIRIDKSGWPALRDAIDRMMDRVRVDDQAEEAEPAWRDPLTAKREERELERMESTKTKLQGTEQGPQEELTNEQAAFVRAAKKVKTWQLREDQMILVVERFEDVAKCLDAGSLVSLFPDSVLRLVAIGIRAERFASIGLSFRDRDLEDVERTLPEAIKYAKKEVEKMIAEARK